MTAATLLAPFITPATRSHARFFPCGPFISVTLAQLILESDWGRAQSGRNNFFGIKARPGQPATLRWTHETLRGQYIKIPQYFADYPDLETCFNAHASLLTSPHYTLCTRATSPQAYAHALRLCNYATGIPSHPYDLSLITIMTAHNLYAYDQVPKPIANVAQPRPYEVQP